MDYATLYASFKKFVDEVAQAKSVNPEIVDRANLALRMAETAMVKASPLKFKEIYRGTSMGTESAIQSAHSPVGVFLIKTLEGEDIDSQAKLTVNGNPVGQGDYKTLNKAMAAANDYYREALPRALQSRVSLGSNIEVQDEVFGPRR